MTAGSPSPRVGLALIAKNEAERLPNLLASIHGCFDRIVLLDTGSTDATVEIFTQWCAEENDRQEGMLSWQTGHVPWEEDFSVARTQADNLLTYASPSVDSALNLGEPMVEWRCWADCDDIIHGASNIRGLVHSAMPGVVAFMVDYDYARDPNTGMCLSYLRRERIVKVGHSTWGGPVHEAQMLTGGAIQQVDPAVLLYQHAKDMGPQSVEGSNDRNLRILNAWYGREPQNPRVIAYLGVENALRGDHETAIRFYNEYLLIDTGWDEERAQVHSRMAASLLVVGRYTDAVEVAMQGVEFMPSWPDNYIRLAEAYLALGKPDKGYHWAKTAHQMGAPEGTLLIVNPLDYTFQPLKLMAGALGDLGRVEEAVRWGVQALGMIPDEQLAAAMAQWQGALKRERTAETFVMCAEQLIAHDEQLKALTLLEDCVPVFAVDHPKVVGIRSMLRERISWAFEDTDYTNHYEVGGSKPEDMIPDDKVDSLCEMLPRTGYLLDGIVGQIEGIKA